MRDRLPCRCLCASLRCVVLSPFKRSPASRLPPPSLPLDREKPCRRPVLGALGAARKPLGASLSPHLSYVQYPWLEKESHVPKRLRRALLLLLFWLMYGLLPLLIFQVCGAPRVPASCFQQRDPGHAAKTLQQQRRASYSPSGVSGQLWEKLPGSSSRDDPGWNRHLSLLQFEGLGQPQTLISKRCGVGF